MGATQTPVDLWTDWTPLSWGHDASDAETLGAEGLSSRETRVHDESITPDNDLTFDNTLMHYGITVGAHAQNFIRPRSVRFHAMTLPHLTLSLKAYFWVFRCCSMMWWRDGRIDLFLGKPCGICGRWSRRRPCAPQQRNNPEKKYCHEARRNPEEGWRRRMGMEVVVNMLRFHRKCH